ncbi:hypothetical protein OG413_09890 [Streptomyces sp. NBC_01433]|uniref:hypothetical protein n=1 Tax=Streptomyces sp. NBC_01433 TaxID=2903864 RepID=UPI0022527826|nr:hypothetical protein [Streptomyces sp. NBC_01433]MCX4675614.1 hypothetical protein [Streptomyces sp. NBC_01433]
MRSSLAVLGSTLLLAVSLATGTASASVPTSSAVSAAPAGAASCGDVQTVSAEEGYARIFYCDGNNRIVGNVYDTKADGRCPYVRAFMSNGSLVSASAGPKGDDSPVDIVAPPGGVFYGTVIDSHAC